MRDQAVPSTVIGSMAWLATLRPADRPRRIDRVIDYFGEPRAVPAPAPARRWPGSAEDASWR